MAFFETVRAAPILFTILSVGPMSSAFAASEAEPSYEEASQWCLPEKEQIRELNDAFASGHPHPDSEHVAAQRAHTDCYNARLQVWKATYAVGTSPASAPAAPPARRVQPQPAPAPGPALSPARSDSNPYRVSRSDAEAVQIATREATAAIDEILAEPAKETARRVAQLEHDNKHEGEDASFCLNPPIFPANGTDPQRLHNHCSYSIEAMWCVEGGDCKPGYSNLHTFAPGASYPISGTSAQDGGLGRRVQFAACRGVNTFKGLKEPFTFLCEKHSN